MDTRTFLEIRNLGTTPFWWHSGDKCVNSLHLTSRTEKCLQMYYTDRQTDTFWTPENAGSVDIFWALLWQSSSVRNLKKLSFAKIIKVSVMEERINVEYWWNNADRDKQKYSGYKPFPLPLCPQQIAGGPLRLELIWSHGKALWLWPLIGRTVTPFICTVGATLTRASLVIILRFEIKGNANYYDLLITTILKF